MAIATRSRSRRNPPDPFAFLEYPDLTRDKTQDPDFPHIMQWATQSEYLGKQIYPRQGTMLKIMFLRDDLFTPYDYEVIDGWIENFKNTGNNGCQPDIYERIQICKEQGRPWFREHVIVVGRRGSKNFIGGIGMSYVLYHYSQRGNPHQYFATDPDQRLSVLVFAQKKEDAKANQWRDLQQMILGSPAFAGRIGSNLNERLNVRANADKIKEDMRRAAGLYSVEDVSTFEVLPKESTATSGRGPAAFIQAYDEMAHLVATGANRSAEEVYGQATPAADQFGYWAFLYEPSSPWQMTGQFYANWEQSLKTDELTGRPARPEMFMLQLTSWDIYKDWQHARSIPMWPGGPNYTIQVTRPPQLSPEEDEQQRVLEESNPETFAVERRSHWAAAIDAYLTEAKVKAIWRPWPDDDRTMVQQSHGRLQLTYRAHGDPSKSGANFGFAMAHIEGPDERGLNHVVFDVLHAWLPSDRQKFPDGILDYDLVEEEIVKNYLDPFMPEEMTFDQFNSVSTIQHLQKHVATQNYPKRVSVYERTATAPLNWRTYETFKTAVNMGLVHAPYFELADLELRFLQVENGKVEHPSSGPVQTKDVADCMAIVTYHLLGNELKAFIGAMLSELSPRGGQPGGFEPGPPRSPSPPPTPSEVADRFRQFGQGQGRGPGVPGGIIRHRRR